MRHGAQVVGGRDGFALIAVLWLVVALATVLSVGLAPARTAAEATENRLAQTRALWAARACVALLQARDWDGGSAPGPDAVALGISTWCSVEPLDWDERVNPNVTDSSALARVLGDSVQVASILDWLDADDRPREAGAESDWYLSQGRPSPRDGALVSVEEISLVRGFEDESPEELYGLFTVRGDGRISPDRAPARALSALTALTPQEISRLVASRSGGGSLTSAESVARAAEMSPSISGFRELTRRLAIGRPERTVRIHGWTETGERRIEAGLIVTLVWVNQSLTIADVEIR